MSRFQPTAEAILATSAGCLLCINGRISISARVTEENSRYSSCLGDSRAFCAVRYGFLPDIDQSPLPLDQPAGKLQELEVVLLSQGRADIADQGMCTRCSLNELHTGVFSLCVVLVVL